jgi:SAM-dependent methyltransferase
MLTPPLIFDRLAVTRNRARAARAPATFLRQAVAAEVQERLNEVNRTFTEPAIVTGWPEVWGRDMQKARIVADDEVLALTPAAHDLVIHDLSLHWANDPVGQLVQCRHALKPDGLLIATLFGGQTLAELRVALSEAEVRVSGGLSPRVAPMGEIRDLGGLLQRAGLTMPVADLVTFDVRYADAFDLMRDLRGMGEGNAMEGRLRRPTAATVMALAAEIYADRFGGADGRIPATFEVIVLTGWAPAPSQPRPLRPGSATHRLADALRVIETPLERSGD